MKVRLITHTPEPEKIVAAAAKLCYSNAKIDDLLNGLSTDKSREFVEMLASVGHESPTEHVSFTFAIEGVSRALLAQITRHRMASFSVQSQRYVELENFEAVVPQEVKKIPQAEEMFKQAMQQEAELYRKMTDILYEKHYNEFLKNGIEKKQASTKAKKQAIEDARFVLPNACTTKMIVTMNARSLNHFFRLRCCNRAQWEIHNLADEMLKLVCKVAPWLFVKAGPGCVNGVCPEGKMTCGKMQEVKQAYTQIIENARADENG